MKRLNDQTVGLLVCCGVALTVSNGCNKEKTEAAAATVANTQAAASGKASASDGGGDGGVACVVGDAPARTFSDAAAPEALMKVMTAAADWQLATPAKWATNLWHHAAFWVWLTKFAPLSDDPKYFHAIKKNGAASERSPAARPRQ